jgi:hypothetical protein
MPKFIIERQYLVPVYQHILVDAPTFEAACEKAVSDGIDWTNDKVDYESAGATTIRIAKEAPEGVDTEQDLVEKHATTFANFLYDGATPELQVPHDFTGIVEY